MTGDDFKKWRRELDLTKGEAARALGLSKASVTNYEAGKRYEDGRPVAIPKTVALACAAVRAGLAPEGIGRAILPKIAKRKSTFKFIKVNDIDEQQPASRVIVRKSNELVGQIRQVDANRYEVKRSGDEVFHSSYANKIQAARWLKEQSDDGIIYDDLDDDLGLEEY